MTDGDKVRLFNISVPGPDKGGIFDRMNVNRPIAPSVASS